MQVSVRTEGFTLIELVVVLALLGVLAAFAIPRFADLGGEAREAALRGMIGSTRSANAMAHGLSLINPAGPNAPVQMDGANITMFNGYPDAPGMLLASQLDGGGDFQVTVFGNVAIVVQANNVPSWVSCGFVWVRSVPPGIPVPRIFGPNTGGC